MKRSPDKLYVLVMTHETANVVAEAKVVLATKEKRVALEAMELEYSAHCTMLKTLGPDPDEDYTWIEDLNAMVTACDGASWRWEVFALSYDENEDTYYEMLIREEGEMNT